MLHCPTDHCLLQRTRIGNGFAFVCTKCQGRAVTMPVLRRQQDADVVRDLWAAASRAKTAGVSCPACLQATVRVDVQGTDGRLEVDVCRGCACVWFDPGEHERVPKAPVVAPVVERPVPAELRERRAILEVEAMAERARFEAGEQPSLELGRLPAILGLPVELYGAGAVARPWLTWGVAALVAVVSIAGFVWPSVVDALQMVPADLPSARRSRDIVLTMLGSFFVHATWWHLLGNLWFLVVFGDNVEQVMGRKAWVSIVVVGKLLGAAMTILWNPHSELASVGASGGISGLIVCYALLMPKARLGMWFWIGYRPVWLTISARTALLAWFVLQAWLLMEELAGFGRVGAIAHLGGACAGVLAWAFWRQRSAA